MRFHQPFDEFLRNRTAVRVLRRMLAVPAKEFTGRELAAESGTPPPNAIRELNRLRTHGLVERRTAGSAQLWRLRQAHDLAAPLARAFAAERTALVRLRRACVEPLARVPGVERLVLIGSVARGDERPDSDVDLVVVVAGARAREAVLAVLDDVAVRVVRTFGNRLSPLVYTRRGLASRRAENVRRSMEREGMAWWGKRA